MATFSTYDHSMMQLALEQAALAAEQGEVPVGAVLVNAQSIIASGYNQPISNHDPSAHAEIVVLRAAGQKLENYRLIDTTLYLTLEPCMMCLGALVHARITRCVIACLEPKSGAVFSNPAQTPVNHQIQFEHGLYADQSKQYLQQFFKSRR